MCHRHKFKITDFCLTSVTPTFSQQPLNTASKRFLCGSHLSSATRFGDFGCRKLRAVSRARSPADFIAKLVMVLEEADESAFWELLTDAGTVTGDGRPDPPWKKSKLISNFFLCSL